MDKGYYNTILCQVFSPCSKYLLAGNIYGQIAIFDLDKILSPAVEVISADYNKPKFVHSLQDEKQICSLVASEKFCIVGTIGNIFGYEWKSILTQKLGKPSWTININSKSAYEEADINSLWLNEDETKLYAGCGDNIVYVYSLEDGSLLLKLEGHTNYIHCVHGKGDQLASAGEDGAVVLWDVRTGRAHHTLRPHDNAKVARPELGRWVGAVALGGDWIVCGGGPQLALWHQRSLDAATVFDVANRGVHVALFHEDCVVGGGAAPHLYRLSFNGELRVELPVTATAAVYSVALRDKPTPALAVAGASMDIDLCTTFNYRDQVLRFR